jgi:hypothetical protein
VHALQPYSQSFGQHLSVPHSVSVGSAQTVACAHHNSQDSHTEPGRRVCWTRRRLGLWSLHRSAAQKHAAAHIKLQVYGCILKYCKPAAGPATPGACHVLYNVQFKSRLQDMQCCHPLVCVCHTPGDQKQCLACILPQQSQESQESTDHFLGVFVTREHVRHNKSGIAHLGRTGINHLRELPTKLNHFCKGSRGRTNGEGSTPNHRTQPTAEPPP